MSELDLRDEIRNKIEEYCHFLHRVLRPQYEDALHVEHVIQCEIEEYETLQRKIQNLRTTSLQTSERTVLVDLGHETVYCHATYNDDTRNEEQKLFVDVGMGLFIEFTLVEAFNFIEKKLHFLKLQKLPKRAAKCQEMKRHMIESELILDQLALELNKSH
jgi:prefoldin subunit 5